MTQTARNICLQPWQKARLLVLMLGAGSVLPSACADVGDGSPADDAQERGQLDDEPGSTAEAIKFAGSCSSLDRSVLRTYEGWLYEYVADAAFQARAHPTGPRFMHWFNAQTEQQQLTVVFVLETMRLLLENIDFTYSCETSCGGNAVAWVNGNDPHVVHLCPSFWDRDNNGRLNVLAHELSHWVGTIDDPRPLTPSDLALEDPAAAVISGKNYGYYVMNRDGLPD